MDKAATSPDRPTITRAALFTAFLKVGLLGFGGVAAWARHVLVVERRWMSEREFTELFGLSSTLPGANTLNLATLFGDRQAGVGGALAALAGLLGAPLLLLLAIASLYARFSSLPDVRAGIAGVAAAAAGIVLGTSIRLFRGIASDIRLIPVVAGVCVAAAFLRMPILVILGVAIPVSAMIVVSQRRAS